jgi:LmbE family N-acetylglucosaminyl deacetylase
MLGLFAHPDDEVFCVGGTLAGLSEQGAVGRIVALTRGEAGEIRDATVASRRTLAEVRERELARAGAVLGGADTRCHGYPDGTLAVQPFDQLVEVCGAAIDEFRPDVVVSFGPDGGYGHPDHVTASAAATEAVRRSPLQPTLLYALFPRTGRLLTGLIIDWLESLDDRYRGTESFANGLMVFANGSSMLGFAADHLDVRFYPSGTFIIEQGEPPGELFLVLSGEVDVVHESSNGGLTRLATLGPGCFVGEDGIARGQPRNANVIAAGSVTCFVLSPGPASESAGRGGTSAVDRFGATGPADRLPPGCIEVDVRSHVGHKVRALACHRSQYAISDDMFPASLVEGLFGTEYFVEVPVGGGDR